MFLLVDTLAVTYSHNLIYNWYKANFTRNDSCKAVPKKNQVRDKSEETWFDRFAKRCTINGVVQFKRISADVKLNGHYSNFGLTHMQIGLKQSTDVRGKVSIVCL